MASNRETTQAQDAHPVSRCALVILVALVGLLSCKPGESGKAPPPPPLDGALARVGSLTIYEHDLQQHLREHHSGRGDDASRQSALNALVRRARFAQAALDAGLADDPVVRAEVGRILEARLREHELAPRIKQQTEIPEERLAEIYQAEIGRFQAPEKRRVAVLWLNPGIDPAKTKLYEEKMQKAHAFVLQSKDLVDHPEKGFAMLGADYSEHSASRYRGGVIGWLEQKGDLDPWTKAVAEIAFSIGDEGGLSGVTTRPEGIFLVRMMDLQPAVTRPFDSVVDELKRDERTRQRKELEDRFLQDIESRYPVNWTER